MKANSRIDDVEARIVQNEESIQGTEEVVTEMLKFQMQLQDSQNTSRSRRESVRIYGVPEGSEGDVGSMITFVEKLLRENLEIASTTDIQIE